VAVDRGLSVEVSVCDVSKCEAFPVSIHVCFCYNGIIVSKAVQCMAASDIDAPQADSQRVG
jgi:hypothetical protein